MVRSKLKALTTHLTVACVLLATLWLLVSDKHVLIIGNSLILVYVVSSLGFCIVPEKDKSKKKKH